MEKIELPDDFDYPLVLTEENFQDAIEKYSFLVVDFWASWCGPCKMMSPVIESLAKKYKGEIVFGKVNVDENPSLAEKFKIMSIPTLIIFKKGEKVDEIIGARPQTLIEEKLLKIK